MPSLKENITEILYKSGNIPKGKLKLALDIQKEKNLPLRKVLVDEGIIAEDNLSSLFSGRLYMPTLGLDKFRFDTDILNLFPEHIARLYNAIPLLRTTDTLVVSTSDPLNIFALDDLSAFKGCKVNLVLSPENEIIQAIECHYSKKASDLQLVQNESNLDYNLNADNKMNLSQSNRIDLPDSFQKNQEPIAELVDIILAHALKRGASDIHIEPELDCLRIRYRLDGSLQDVLSVPKINQNSILARLKIISGLDITENRIPQDGKFKVKTGAQEMEFRVSSLPTTFGQKFVLHALDKSKLVIGLGQLGFSDSCVAALRVAAAKSFGLVLISGPAASGKSTTLYSILNQLNSPDKNIVTIEDPIEYQIDGLTQVQVKPDMGIDFACGLRSILRQTPDVVMVGQIRDSETADIAVKAALSGQFVLSSLQENDAISNISRLIEMGVEPFLVASSLVMLCTQRLARKICFKCRKPIDIPKDFLEKIKFSGKTKFYSAQGCKHCNYTGFSGRLAILETLLIDDTIRDIIVRKKPMAEIRKYALKHLGMKTLRDNAYLKVKEEQISLAEAIRITAEE